MHPAVNTQRYATMFGYLNYEIFLLYMAISTSNPIYYTHPDTSVISNEFCSIFNVKKVSTLCTVFKAHIFSNFKWNQKLDYENVEKKYKGKILWAFHH